MAEYIPIDMGSLVYLSTDQYNTNELMSSALGWSIDATNKLLTNIDNKIDIKCRRVDYSEFIEDD